MSSRRKVCVVVTARPSYSRIKTVLSALASRSEIELQLVVSASALLHRYGDARGVIERDGFHVDATVYMVLEGENPAAMAKTTGIGLLELSTVFDNLRPDAVVTVADRFETLATAVAASYMNIPLAHVQGGEVSGSIDEKVRHAVTKLSDLHFVASDGAYERVVRMGEHPETVHVTGCPSVDLAAAVAANPRLDFDPLMRYGGVGAPLDLTDGFLVVMQHPVTTAHEDARQHVVETLESVHTLGLPTLWFWPNVDAGSGGAAAGIRAFREQWNPPNIHFFRSMDPEDFLRVLVNARCLVGNSSVGIREGSFLGVPVVNIGNRQAGRERASNVLDAEYERESIRDAIERQVAHGRYDCSYVYGDGSAGPRIANLLSKLELHVDKRLAY